MTDVDNFLAHYGVKGMKWGVRIASDLHASYRAGKTPQELKERAKKEKQLKDLINQDLHPGRTFVNDIIKEHQGQLISGLGLGLSTAAGVAFMAWKLKNQFKGISISPIPLG